MTARAEKPWKVHSPAANREAYVRCTSTQLHCTGAPRTATSTRRRRACAARADDDERLVPRPRAPFPRGSSSRNGDRPEQVGRGRRLGARAAKNNGGSSRQTRNARHVGTRPSRNSGRPGPNWPTGTAFSRSPTAYR